MSKFFIIKLTPGLKISVNPNLPVDFKGGFWKILFDLTNMISKVCWIVFFILLLSSTLFDKEVGIGAYLFTLIIILFQLFLQIIKNFCTKNDLFPSVANDFVFLILTSLISLSLFVNLIMYKDSVNVWGGKTFHAISGISFILYWFMFYLLGINFATKKKFHQLVKLFSISFLISFIVSLIFSNNIPVDLLVILAIFNPGWLILTLTQKKNILIYFLNFIVSLFIFCFISNDLIHILIFTIYFSLFLIVLFKKRNTLLSLFKNLDNRKIPFLTYLQNNYLIIIFIFSLIFSLVGLVWFRMNFGMFIFDKVIIGFNSVKFTHINNVLLGNGLFPNGGSVLFQFLSTFGVIPFIGIILIILYLIRGLLSIIKSSSLSRVGLNLFFLIELILLLTYLFLENIGINLILIILVVLITMVSIQKQIYLIGKELNFSDEISDLSFIEKKNHRFFYNFLRILFCLLITITFLYLLSNLNYINISIRV